MSGHDADTHPDAPAVQWVDGADQARAFAEWILDPARERPIVAVTTAPHMSEPSVDPQRAAERLGDSAEVWALRGARETWALADALPERMDVYGGAARVWQPIPDPENVDRFNHPRFLTYGPDTADVVLRQIISAVATPSTPVPQPGEDITGVITAVLSTGAEIRLIGDHKAFATLRHLSAGEIYHAREAVKVGQEVRVRVSPTSNGAPRSRLLVSLLPFAPDPWTRLGEVYAEGMIVEGVVAQLRDFGAMIDLMPGVFGLVANANISRDYVVHPSEHLSVDDSVLVRIASLDIGARRAYLSMVDVPDGATAEPAASIYPGGPPWLAPDIEPVEVASDLDTPAAAPAPEPSANTPAPADAGANRTPGTTSDEDARAGEPAPPAPPAPAPEADAPTPTQPAAAQRSAETEPQSVGAPVAREVGERPEISAVPAGLATEADVRALREAIGEAGEARAGLRDGKREAARELESLRATARGLVQELREEITDASLRIAGLGGGRLSALKSAQDTVESLRQEVEELRDRLRVAEAERRELIGVQSRLEERLGRAHADVADERERAERADQQAADLRDQLAEVDGANEGRRFLRELRHVWSRINTHDADRERYPYREPTLGPAFLDSVEQTEGISRARVLEVCAHVASGRAHEIAGLELHQLRSSQGGDSGPRIRASDGATGWRVSLQVKSHSARRLHYWLLADGTIEFSKVGTHDDLTII